MLKGPIGFFRQIPVGELTRIHLIGWVISGLAAIGAIAAAYYASRPIAEPRLEISFKQKEVAPYNVRSPRHSVGIIPVWKTEAYRSPLKTLGNDLLILNKGDIWAQKLIVRLSVKNPFVFVNVFFHEDPLGRWRVTPNKNTYRLVTLELFDPIPPHGETRISFVYTYPKQIPEPQPKGEKPDALTIRVTSEGMRATGGRENTYSLKYWEN